MEETLIIPEFDRIPKVFLLGYSDDIKQEILDEIINQRRVQYNRGETRRNLYIVDIRNSPRTQIPGWSGEALEKKYGLRYRFIGNLLGNKNYRPEDRHKGIVLLNEKEGIPKLIAGLEMFDMILICGCGRDKRHEAGSRVCHRFFVARKLKAQRSDIRFINM